MLVGNRITEEPITAGPNDLLSRAAHKMTAGGFRRPPVVTDGKLVATLTERDLREHRGHLEQVKINGVMTEKPVTARPETILEEAGQIVLERQIGGWHGEIDGIRRLKCSPKAHSFI